MCYVLVAMCYVLCAMCYDDDMWYMVWGWAREERLKHSPAQVVQKATL